MLMDIVDATSSTLHFFRLHLNEEDFEGADHKTIAFNMMLLLHRMSRVRRLEELELKVMMPIPIAEYES